LEIQVEPRHWSYYYAPTADMILSTPEYAERMLQQPVLIPAADVGIHPAVLRALTTADWEGARHIAQTLPNLHTDIPYRHDGIAVVAGENWLKPLDEREDIVRFCRANPNPTSRCLVPSAKCAIGYRQSQARTLPTVHPR
jgi:hypothetical protein